MHFVSNANSFPHLNCEFCYTEGSVQISQKWDNFSLCNAISSLFLELTDSHFIASIMYYFLADTYCDLSIPSSL